MKNKAPNTKEVYSTTGFSDLVSSPFFLSVLILTIILGLASTFGFFKNPRKLKLIIDLISQRIFISEAKIQTLPRVVHSQAYAMEQRELQVISKKDGNITVSSLNKDRYTILSSDDFSFNNNASLNPTISVSIDYNIASLRFWGSLNSSNSNRLIIGAPISPSYSLDIDQSQYDLRNL